MRIALLVLALMAVSACTSPVKGERLWWDDQKREQLPNTYMLPEWPAEAPVPTDPEPYVPKELPRDEIKRATAQQHQLIEQGIPRAGSPNPETDRVKVPVAKWQGADDFSAPAAPAVPAPAPAAPVPAQAGDSAKPAAPPAAPAGSAAGVMPKAAE